MYIVANPSRQSRSYKVLPANSCLFTPPDGLAGLVLEDDTPGIEFITDTVGLSPVFVSAGLVALIY